MRENAGKMRTRITWNTDTFYAVDYFEKFCMKWINQARFLQWSHMQSLLPSLYLMYHEIILRNIVVGSPAVG